MVTGIKGIHWQKLFKIILIIWSVFVFAYFAFFKQPERYGDGFEYIYMTESFIQHKTPEQLNTDVEIAQEKLKLQNPHIYLLPERSGYYENNAGDKWFSYHFWLYPLVASPVQQVVESFHGNSLRAFSITNAILYITMLWCVYLLSAADKKNWLVLLMAMSPLVPYIGWPHPEVFSAALVTIALAFYFRKNLQMAILLSGLASCQNPPIIFFSIYCGCAYLYQVYKTYVKNHTFDFREFIITGLCAVPLLLSPIFYFLNYSAPNLIAKVGSSKLEFINFNRFFSYLFDLNQGILVYSGLLLFVFLWFVIKNIISRNFKYFELVIVSLFVIGASLTTSNWNCGQTSVLRYCVWFYPFMVFYVIYFINFEKRKTLGYLLVINMFLLCCVQSWFNGNDRYIYHNLIARTVLSNYPSLYNPEHDIFVYRTLNRPEQASYPVAYINSKSEVTKILTDKDAWIDLPNNGKYKIKDKGFYEKQLSKFKTNKPRYVNLTNNQIIASSPILEINKKINFNEVNENIRGLSGREDWGRWSDSSQVDLRLKFNSLDRNKKRIALKFEGTPFLTPLHESLNIDVYGNDELLDSWKFTPTQSDFEKVVYISKDSIYNNKQILDLTFKIDNPISPKQAGLGSDSRKLGFGFVSVEIIK